MSVEHENIALIAGGTSGLGLEMARLLRSENNFKVYVTGRREPVDKQLSFVYFNIDSQTDQLPRRIDKVLSGLPEQIDLFVCAMGFYQEGSMKQFSDEDILKMMNVGLVAPTLILSRILNRQGQLPGFIAITSTSQWTPRIYEPVYTTVKAGLGMLANSLSLDPQVGKVLVVGPAGMKTNFWADIERDTSKMLEPTWVAEQICQLYFGDNFKYKCARILREPSRVEVVEKR